jgi:hypothetical protein
MFIIFLIYEFNKRIDDIKYHRKNNSFLYAMKKKINNLEMTLNLKHLTPGF